ncbi:hypothetical protein VNO80_26284 [Phaseolus coccineus]|uniref:Uncharacterized protein n=1 Tax=Phaseolus coccineus TaxID=3886 RepID=A0AAN9LEI6_PHACN
MHTSSPWPSIRWSTSAPSPSLTVPPSLGLFSGQSAARTFSSHSNVDWNTGGMMPEFDYTRVDWSLDCTSLSFKQGKDIFSLPTNFVTSPPLMRL